MIGIESLGGEDLLLHTIKQARKDKVFKNNMQATRIIQDIKNTYFNEVFTESHGLVKELEDKIPEKLNGYLPELVVQDL